jgi:hypothetical protein
VSREDLSSLVQRVLDEGHVNLHTLAERSGHSYQTLRSWSNGRRTPSSRKHVLRLAGALESSSDKLRELARHLREAADAM